MSDGKTISTIAAAKDYPEKFSNDYVYGNPKNYLFYTPLYVELIRWGRRISGHYRFSFRVLFIVILLFHLCGYYLLGTRISQNKAIGLLFSLLVLCPLRISFETWGIEGENSALPRNLFSSLLPFILLLYMNPKLDQKRWLIMMILSGLTIYIHPVSTPYIGIACLMAAGVDKVMNPGGPSWKNIVVLACILFLITIPYGIWYGIYHEHGKIPEHVYPQVMSVMRMRVHSFWFYPLRFISYTVNKIWIQIGLASLLILPALYFGLKKKFSRLLTIRIVVLIAGVFVVSLIIPLVDHNLARTLKILPFELDLVRNIRYLIPLAYLGFPLFWLISSDFSNKIKVSTRMASIFLVLWSIYSTFPAQLARYFHMAWISSHPYPPPSIEKAIQSKMQAIDKIRELTKPNSVIMGSLMEIRYVAFRPLYFNHKDGGLMLYANWQGLLEWYRRKLIVDKLEGQKGLANQFNILRNEKVDYWLLEINELSKKTFDPKDLKNHVVWENVKYILLKL